MRLSRSFQSSLYVWKPSASSMVAYPSTAEIDHRRALYYESSDYTGDIPNSADLGSALLAQWSHEVERVLRPLQEFRWVRPDVLGNDFRLVVYGEIPLQITDVISLKHTKLFGISERVVEVLQRFGLIGRLVQTIPVPLYAGGENHLLGTVYLMNPLLGLNCTDAEASNWEEERLVLCAGLVPHEVMFCTPSGRRANFDLMVLREELKQALKAIPITGARFIPVALK
ncbi:hypothetical protein HRbin14_02276 [bacterium HR14]|nr:hypothetical protein HRbin14_02276 [bacterium HR14]